MSKRPAYVDGLIVYLCLIDVKENCSNLAEILKAVNSQKSSPLKINNMQYHRDTNKAKNSVPGGSWAAFFKAKTWEEMRMLAERKPDLQSSVETLYQLNCDEQIRETLDRFVRAQRREQGYLDTISEQQDTISEQQERLSAQEDTISEQQEKLSAQEETISEQQEKLSTQENTISSLEQENAALRAELEALQTQK